MNRIKYLLILGFLPLLTFGQTVKNTTTYEGAPSWFETVQPVHHAVHIQVGEATATEVLKQVLDQQDLPYGESSFGIAYERKSPLGRHVEFAFKPYGVIMPLHFLKVFITNSGEVLDLVYLLPPTDLLYPTDFPSAAYIEQLTRAFPESHPSFMAYVFDGKQVHACRGLNVRLANLQPEERYYNSDGVLIYRRGLRRHFIGQDTVARGKVFLPDPLTSAKVNYGDTVGVLVYKDFNDADTPSLNNERFEVDLSVRLDQDTFRLEDSTFYFVDIESPYVAQPLLTQGNFSFTRGDDNFEFVNVFYHLQNMKRLVDSLGYSGLPGNRIQVDAHGFNGLDASGFDPQYNPPALIFGDGGIDDGEDADVIVHEFGHGLSFGAAPGTSNGLERRSIDEGQSDYMAMSYSRRMNPFNWQKTFNWDGNQSWEGRTANSTKILPDDYNSDIYNNGEIWCSAFAEMFDSLGADVTDRLVLGGLYFQFSNMSMRDMAYYTLMVDSLQNNQENKEVIRLAFDRRRILWYLGTDPVKQSARVELRNSIGFIRGESIVLEINDSRSFDGQFRLIDVQGRILEAGPISSGQRWTYKAVGIKKGLYILQVDIPGLGQYSYRLFRDQ